MSVLLLRLAAPLQSWGTDSKFETRRTGYEPSKSGVIGLLSAALGLARDSEKIADLNKLRFAVRVDQEGKLLRDFHIAHGDKPYLTTRYYLSDAIFLVALESEDLRLLEKLEKALQTPYYPLFLGRRSCPPTFPLCLGIKDNDIETCFKEIPLLIPNWRTPSNSVRIVIDSALDKPGVELRQDLPISFSQEHRQFGYRAVKETREIWLQETEHDAFEGLED